MTFTSNKTILGRLQAEFRGKASHVAIKNAYTELGGDYKRIKEALERNAIEGTSTTTTVMSSEFKERKKAHQTEIAEFHRLKAKAAGPEKEKLAGRINEKVAEWNANHQIHPAYFDLHGMTEQGAVEYVEHILQRREWSTLELETGQGHHSRNNEPVIKQKLLKMFRNRKRCTVRTQCRNAGVLVVNFW